MVGYLDGLTSKQIKDIRTPVGRRLAFDLEREQSADITGVFSSFGYKKQISFADDSKRNRCPETRVSIRY